MAYQIVWIIYPITYLDIKIFIYLYTIYFIYLYSSQLITCAYISPILLSELNILLLNSSNLHMSDYRINTLLSIHTKLIQKYSISVCFYCSHSIYQIMQNSPDRHSIKTHDVAYFAEQKQYMQRMYHQYTVFGEKQSERKIKKFAEFYDSIRSFGCFYPNILVHGTEIIFKARLRKLKKLKASHWSSDEPLSNSYGSSYSYSTFGILENINNSKLSSQSDFSAILSSFNIGKSYLKSSQTEIFDIYTVEQSESNNGQPSSSEHLFSNLSSITQQEVQHLITEFNDLNPETIIENLKQLIEFAKSNQTANSIRQQDLNAIQKLINSPEQEQIMRNFEEEDHYLTKTRRHGHSDPSKLYRRQTIQGFYQKRYKDRETDMPYKLERGNKQKKGYPNMQNYWIKKAQQKTVKDKATQLLERINNNQ